MWNGLEKLIELQRLDQAVALLEGESQAIPQEIQALEVRLTGARTGRETAKNQSEQLQKERRGKERELDEAGLNIKKKQARLFEIKTNEEYSAVLREIDALKGKCSKLEEEILLLLDRGDEAAKAVTAAEGEFRAAEAVYQRERAEKEAHLTKLQRELADLREARKGQASRLDRSLLQQYTRLVKTRGTAVVAVKNGSCTGCGIALTPQAYSEVRRNDRMYTCTSCNRILHYAG
jgi:predicted  nucleic acid-binding Zn-ribbon protein